MKLCRPLQKGARCLQRMRPVAKCDAKGEVCALHLSKLASPAAATQAALLTPLPRPAQAPHAEPERGSAWGGLAHGPLQKWATFSGPAIATHAAIGAPLPQPAQAPHAEPGRSSNGEETVA